ncbi:hypothetical protein F5050DRAFT_1813160, partial [Lentinula boryana]
KLAEEARLLTAANESLKELETKKDGLQTSNDEAEVALETLRKKNRETDQQLKETERKVSELQATVDAVTLLVSQGLSPSSALPDPDHVQFQQAKIQKDELQKSFDQAKRELRSNEKGSEFLVEKNLLEAKTQALERSNKQLETANKTLEADLLRSEELAHTLRSDTEALVACQAELKRLKSQNITLVAKNAELKSLANPSPVGDPETSVSRVSLPDPRPISHGIYFLQFIPLSPHSNSYVQEKLQTARKDLFTEQEKADRLEQEVADLEEDRDRWETECSMFMEKMREYGENDDIRVLQDELLEKNKEISRLKKRFDDSQVIAFAECTL